MAKSNNNKWPWWKVLLWAYSTLWMILVLVLAFVDPSISSQPVSQEETYFGIATFIPILAFLILEGIDHLKN